MLEETDARTRILELVEIGSVAWLPLDLCRGLISAQPLQAIADFPEFDNSSMDGYAVRAGDAFQGAKLLVGEEVQPAGLDRELTLAEGGAIRIFTGAPIPSGADAVIMQEDVERSGNEIVVVEAVVPGENIRRRGGDVCSGQLILEKGKLITPTVIALLASQGIEEIPVFLRPMVHIVTTGDELIQPGDYRMPGQIFDSNGILLKSAVEEIGAIAERVHVPDNRELMQQTFSVLCQISDFLIIAGGVSVGERDFVRSVLTEMGVETGFWRINLKPGKPFLFGRHPDGCLIFGLPGNPVSAFVTCHLFAIPALEKKMGRKLGTEFSRGMTEPLGIAGEEFSNFGDRPHYLRGREEAGTVLLSGTQQSHAMFGLSKANCLIRIDSNQTIAQGQVVEGIRI